MGLGILLQDLDFCFLFLFVDFFEVYSLSEILRKSEKPRENQKKQKTTRP